MNKILWLFYFWVATVYAQVDLNEFLQNVGVKLAPGANIRRVKLDIGLSYNAPQSQKWLSEESDLLVFGFEPYLPAVEEIKKGAQKRSPEHGDPLDVKFLKEGRFQLIPCALGEKQGAKKFYIPAINDGFASFFRLKDFAEESCVEVPVYTLSDFFDLFPFDQFPYIDYIKIDAQGSDLDILKGAGDYLSERVVYITLEPENNAYKGTDNSIESICNFMLFNGFFQVYDQETDDPTFLNQKFKDYPRLYSIQCYQRG